MKFRILLAALWISCAAPQAFAACWEYKILSLAGPDKLEARSDKVVSAASALEAVLNRLGRRGWEVSSEHTVRVYDERNPDRRSPNMIVAQLEPAGVLLKRTVKCVQAGK